MVHLVRLRCRTTPLRRSRSGLSAVPQASRRIDLMPGVDVRGHCARRCSYKAKRVAPVVNCERRRHRAAGGFGTSSPGEFVAIFVPQRAGCDQRVGVDGAGEAPTRLRGLLLHVVQPGRDHWGRASSRDTAILRIDLATAGRPMRIEQRAARADVSPDPTTARSPHRPRPPCRTRAATSVGSCAHCAAHASNKLACAAVNAPRRGSSPRPGPGPTPVFGG